MKLKFDFSISTSGLMADVAYISMLFAEHIKLSRINERKLRYEHFVGTDSFW